MGKADQIQCLMPGDCLDRQSNNTLLSSTQTTKTIGPSTNEPLVTIWPGGHRYSEQATNQATAEGYGPVIFCNGPGRKPTNRKVRRSAKAKKHLPQKRSCQKMDCELSAKEIVVSERISNSDSVPAKPSGNNIGVPANQEIDLDEPFPGRSHDDPDVMTAETMAQVRAWVDLIFAGNSSTVRVEKQHTAMAEP